MVQQLLPVFFFVCFQADEGWTINLSFSFIFIFIFSCASPNFKWAVDQVRSHPQVRGICQPFSEKTYWDFLQLLMNENILCKCPNIFLKKKFYIIKTGCRSILHSLPILLISQIPSSSFSKQAWESIVLQKQNIYIHENIFVFQKLTNPTLFRCSNDKSNHVRDLKYMKQLCFNAGASAVLLAF